MAALHSRFKYDLVILVGGNIYGPQRPQDYQNKFELPYKPLLDAGVRFHAALGQDDAREQRYYKLFNMNGQLYYTFKAAPDVQFFGLETTYLVPQQIQWLEQQLQASTSAWKIAFFHHPLYSSANSGDSGSQLRAALEPLFVKYNVSVVLTGQHRFYERLKLQKGVAHFLVGSGGQLQTGQLDKNSALTANGFDTDQAFMAVEIVGDEMFFQTISREGQTIDTGVIRRRAAAPVGMIAPL
jgi:hypothetical protein